MTKSPLVAGAAEQVSLNVTNNIDAVNIYAVVDDNGGLNERKEANNETPHLLVCVSPN